MLASRVRVENIRVGGLELSFLGSVERIGWTLCGKRKPISLIVSGVDLAFRIKVAQLHL